MKGPYFRLPRGPGAAFLQRTRGDVFHTYLAYARGLDILIGAYNLLDLVPKGRDEEELSYGMEWVRHRDPLRGWDVCRSLRHEGRVFVEVPRGVTSASPRTASPRHP